MNRREKEAHEAYRRQQFFGEQIAQGFSSGISGATPNMVREDLKREPIGDTRYNTPKESPKTADHLVEKTVIDTEIYRIARIAILRHNTIGHESKAIILGAQRKQVAYGLDKYPEPLNPNTWSIDETIDHIMDESIDKLHYLVMLRIKLEQRLAGLNNGFITEFRNVSSRIVAIGRMIDDTIGHMDYLITMNDTHPNDSMDALAYGMLMMKNTGLSIGGADMDGDKVLYADGIPYVKADVLASVKFNEEMYTSDNQDKINKGE